VQWCDQTQNMGVKKRLKIAERLLIGGRKKRLLIWQVLQKYGLGGRKGRLWRGVGKGVVVVASMTCSLSGFEVRSLPCSPPFIAVTSLVIFLPFIPASFRGRGMCGFFCSIAASSETPRFLYCFLEMHGLYVLWPPLGRY
jgi:hypothetical protein